MLSSTPSGRPPGPRSPQVERVALGAGVLASLLVVGGLVLRIVQWRRGRPILRRSVADAVLVLTAGIFLVVTVG